MDDTSFKILETLSRELWADMSINQLTEKIGEAHGKAYYANIYKKIQQLASDNIVAINKVGNTSIARLNFDNYWIVDVLAQVEIIKKQRFLAGRAELQALLRNVETTYDRLWEEYRKQFEDSQDQSFIRSISAIRPERNEMLNRLELLVLLRGQGASGIHAALAREVLQGSMKIDILVLTEAEFSEMLSSREINPVKETLSNKIAFFGPQNFWHAVRAAVEKGAPGAGQEETIPAKIAEQDLAYNMARFGYKEMGTKISKGRDICIEYVVAAMIAQGDARRMEAVPVLLSKNKANYNILIFLSRKFKFADRLLGLLAVLEEITPKEHKKIDMRFAVRTLEEMKVRPVLADRAGIMEKMRLYNAA